MGPRILSSCLNEAGFHTRKIFLQISEEKGDIPPGLFLYPPHVLEQIGELCDNALFVGVSLMTNYFDRVAQLCRFVRERVGVPVVVGGIHATLMPKECAEFADYVCIGEGEGAVVDIAKALSSGRDASGIPNICCIKDGEFIRNPVRPLIADLDDIPFPDYSLDDDYVLMDGSIRRLDLRMLEQLMLAAPGKKVAKKPYYITMMTRGCQYACAYCCNRALLKLYGGRAFVRRRSIDNIIAELSWVQENLPFVEIIVLTDDSFFDADESEIEAFCAVYKEKIGLPFFSLGTPFGITAKKLSTMVDAGMIYVQMGIQTGSERIRKMYRRPFTNKEIVAIAGMFSSYVHKILPPRYDIIIDNPMEADEDVIDTIRLLLKLKRPYFIQYFCLTLFPGTELGEKAARAGIITDWREQVYRKQLFHKRRTYLNFVLSLFNTPVPKFIIRLLITRAALVVFNRPYFGKLLRLVVRD
ncbi:MAG: radical SAM protein [Candidatus Coatesbacteria bacterium]|nr:MAG: radical SAM protein [Candidatus Coatesbacteria bacterium]